MTSIKGLEELMRGPIDYVIAGFTGNHFKGDILRELQKAVEDKTIALLDLAVISKDEKGEVHSIEIAEADDPIVNQLSDARETTEGGLIDADDVAEVGELLENNSTAGLLIIEQLWAKGLKRAIIDAKGTLLAEGRIHPEAFSELNAQGA